MLIETAEDFSELEIENVVKSDEGEYTCLVKNDFGQDKCCVTLTIEGKNENCVTLTSVLQLGPLSREVVHVVPSYPQGTHWKFVPYAPTINYAKFPSCLAGNWWLTGKNFLHADQSFFTSPVSFTDSYAVSHFCLHK